MVLPTNNINKQKSMFSGSSVFNKDIGQWNVSKGEYFVSMIRNVVAIVLTHWWNVILMELYSFLQSQYLEFHVLQRIGI